MGVERLKLENGWVEERRSDVVLKMFGKRYRCVSRILLLKEGRQSRVGWEGV